jgi:hypothetical protein
MPRTAQFKVHYNPNAAKDKVTITGGGGPKDNGDVTVREPTNLVYARANAKDSFHFAGCVVSTAPLDCAALPSHPPSLPYTQLPPDDAGQFSAAFSDGGGPPSLTIGDQNTDAVETTYHYAVGITTAPNVGPVFWSDPKIVNQPQ